MNTIKRKAFWPAILGVMLVLALFTGTLMQTPVEGAPLGAPTPIAQYPTNPQPRLVSFWSAASLTADARSTCFDLSGYNTLDLQYILDQGTTNTTTVNLQFSNIPGSYVSGVAVVTANAADATDLKEFNLFGGRTCLYADVTNSNSLSVTVVGLAK